MPTLFRNRILNHLIKALIAILLAWAIYNQVFAHHDAKELWQSLLLNFECPNCWWLLFVIFLMPFNICFEALKWGTLIKSFSTLKYWQVLKAILSGVTIAIFTPNRIGEYGGRILFVPAEENWKAVIATLVGSIAQLLIILSAGLIGLIFFSNLYFELDHYSIQLVVSLSLVIIGGLSFCFFNVDLLIPLIKRIPFINRFKRFYKHLIVLKNYQKTVLTKSLFFALLRYATYSIQYFLLLKFFGINVPLLLGLAGIATIFFVQASIPLPPVMGLLARGEIALFVWGNFSEDQIGILATTFTLFVINIALPALIGMVFIIQANILKSLGYENGTKE